MRVFFWINGLAGQSAIADALFRGVYVAAVPLLWIALAGVLVLLPRQEGAPARHKVALGALVGGVLCLLLMGSINAFAQHVLNSPVLCDRPFVTRRVTLLLIEPNDNSFPSPEVMLAACAAFALSVALPRRGWLIWLVVLLLGWARVFCGSNFPADALAGMLLGGALSAASLATFRATWRIRSARGSWRWRTRQQAFLSTGTVVVTLLVAFVTFALTPRYLPRLAALVGTPANAAPPTGSTAHLAPQLAAQTLRMRTGGLSTVREGEGASATNEEPVSAPSFPTNQTVMGGNLPQDEAHLLNALRALHLPHRLVSVDVAEIRAGTTPYRTAAVRFEVSRHGPRERRLVAATAAAIVRVSFRADPHLSNVDVLGVSFNTEPATQQESNPEALGEDGRPALAGGVLPVFTASIERRAAELPGYNSDAGTWLRARSLLYIDDVYLPATAPPSRTAPSGTSAHKAASSFNPAPGHHRVAQNTTQIAPRSSS